MLAETIFWQNLVSEQLTEYIPRSVETVMRNSCLFGYFRTALDESKHWLYEDIQDYVAAKAMFQEVGIF